VTGRYARACLRVARGTATSTQIRSTLEAAFAEPGFPGHQLLTNVLDLHPGPAPEEAIADSDSAAVPGAVPVIDLTSPPSEDLAKCLRSARVRVHEPTAGLAHQHTFLLIEFLVPASARTSGETVIAAIKSVWDLRLRPAVIAIHQSGALRPGPEDWIGAEVLVIADSPAPAAAEA
jgi:hypothetical protein